MDLFEKASTCVCTSTTVVSPGLLSPIQSASSALKTPEHTEEEGPFLCVESADKR